MSGTGRSEWAPLSPPGFNLFSPTFFFTGLVLLRGEV